MFIYNTFGFLLLHPFLKEQIKESGMNKVENPAEHDLIEKIVLIKDDILYGRINYRRIHSKEFRLDGKMYDVIEEKETYTQLIIYCINDENEEEYEKYFESKSEDNSDNKKRNSRSNHLFKILISEAADYVTYNYFSKYHSTSGSYYLNSYISSWQEIPSPPPKNFS